MRVGDSLKRLADVARAMPLCLMSLARDRWTRRRLESYQQQRLDRLVRYAIARSPAYKELYGSLRTNRPVKLEALPIIDKKTLMQNFDRFVTDRRLRLTELEAHVRQLSYDEYFQDEYRVLTTAGSSGFRGIFVYSREAWSIAISCIFRWGMFMGVRSSFPKRMKCAMIAAGSAAHASYRGAAGAEIGLNKWLLLRATDRLDFLVDSLNTFRPEL